MKRVRLWVWCCVARPAQRWLRRLGAPLGQQAELLKRQNPAAVRVQNRKDAVDHANQLR
eukprot:SAG22_NODE_1383_length_4542_cov_2.418636_3_plen_59_part_00